MSALKKEHSMVRFAQGTKTLPKLTHVYRPELHRQVTERVPVSRLGHELTQLCQTGLGEEFDAAAVAQAKVELNELLDKILLSLKRNRLGLDMLAPVPLHSFPHWHVTPETHVVCLLPVSFQKVKVIQKDAGHVLLKLPPASQHSSPNSEQNPQADIRTKDGLHVSPRKLHVACAKLVHSSLLRRGVAKERIHASSSASDLGIFVRLDCGWFAELVPCVAAPGGDSDTYFVTRRFSTETFEKGDFTWRSCSSAMEHELLRSISLTDGGLRMRAMHVVCRLLSRDWRLAHFTCYHVQTSLLHDMDFHVDYSPRWQRCTLESCVTSLLRTLLYFVDRENLSHFHLNQLNLWEHMTQRQLTQARGALKRLLTNENALISLVRRASNESVSMDFGQLNLF